MSNLKSASHKEIFCSLFSEEKDVQDPHEFLLSLWENDKESFCTLIKDSVAQAKSYRGMIECISRVAINIGDNDVKKLIEEIVLLRKKRNDISDKLILTALLLGSDKVKDYFKKIFEKAISCCLDSPDYNDAIVVHYLEIIALAGLTDTKDLIDKLLTHKDEQYHRKNKCLTLGTEIASKVHKRLQKNDSNGIKLAEAVRDYFAEGAVYLRSYLNSTDNEEDRAFYYLYCLACHRDKEDFEFFLDYYNKHTDVRLKSICVEALIYLDCGERSLSFLNQEFEKFDFNKIFFKRSIDLGIVNIQRCPELFYRLLEICYFVDTLDEALIDKMQTFRKARNNKIASLSNVVLHKFGCLDIDREKTDKELLTLMRFSSSPAGLLSLSIVMK